MYTNLLHIIHQNTQDRTHPPEYYNPEYDVKVDHGTVSLTLSASGRSHSTSVDFRVIPQLLTKMAWQLP